MDSRSKTPSQELHGRDSFAPVFDNLNIYKATTHFNGQSTIKLRGTLANGGSYCLAHHVKIENGRRSLMFASIRYLDSFTKQDGAWYFDERKLMVEWIETRPLSQITA
jgi:hypothetical protein